jgi:hypothetical protein
MRRGRSVTADILHAMPRPPAGLCDSCRHQRVVRNTRGSVFSLCERSRTDPDYPRYPRLPVVECAGHEPRPPAEAPAR